MEPFILICYCALFKKNTRGLKYNYFLSTATLFSRFASSHAV